MRRVLVLSAALAAAGLLVAPAAASIVLRVTPRELADTANLVVEGRVATVDVRWDEGHTCINTYATLQVERVHKGRVGGQVVVKVPGGRVGDEQVRVEGTARFAAGEEAMVFLWKDGKGEWIVLGEAQGKFLLTQDARSGKRMAENSLKGLCLVLRGDPKAPAAEASKRPDRLAYDDLVATVRASVEAERRTTTTGTASTAPTGGGATTTTAPTGGNATATGGDATATGGGTTDAGRDPAPRDATPDPPTSKEPDAGAPPPTQDAPAPPAEEPAPPAQEPKPAPDAK